MKKLKNSKNEQSSQAGYEFLDHPADVLVHAWGESLADAFEQCVYALMKVMTDPKDITPNFSYEFSMKNDDKGSLLIEFLSEFLFLFDAKGYLFKKIHIDPIILNDERNWILTAVGEGEIFNPEKHFCDTEVKAITYSYLDINESQNEVEIKIIYDI
jgi:SHS2 domain-containing protein